MPGDKEPVAEGQYSVSPEVRAKMDQAGPFILLLAAQTGRSLRATTEEYAATVQTEISTKEKQA